jgi:hypothetical protein
MKWIKIIVETGENTIMYRRLLTLSIRVCLGILVILNGPANAIALAFVSTQSCCSCAVQDAAIQQGTKQGPKKCCGRCGRTDQPKNDTTKAAPKENPNKIRPTCPVCPSCPNFPNGCCVNCPCKAPCAPPVIFMMPESPGIVWRLTDEAISFSKSHSDEPMLPPRGSQFVAFTI